MNLFINAILNILTKILHFIFFLKRTCDKKTFHSHLNRRYAIILSILIHHKSSKKSNL